MVEMEVILILSVEVMVVVCKRMMKVLKCYLLVFQCLSAPV